MPLQRVLILATSCISIGLTKFMNCGCITCILLLALRPQNGCSEVAAGFGDSLVPAPSPPTLLLEKKFEMREKNPVVGVAALVCDSFFSSAAASFSFKGL